VRSSSGIAPELFRDAVLAAVAATGEPGAWEVEQGSRRDPWIGVRRTGHVSPSQGWKLHVSAALPSARTVLERALPVLLAERLVFKVAASPMDLVRLNRGEGGQSQVGKFITVYPADDQQAVRMAVALDAATAGLPGPKVPSDRPLRPGSLVHYRYGAFATHWFQPPTGEVVPAIRTPGGAWEPDTRLTAFSRPAWAPDPFLAAGATTPKDPVNLLVADRYLSVGILHQSWRSTVRLAFDTLAREPRVLKQAPQWSGLEGDGEAADRLRREAATLRELDGDPRVPRVYDMFEDGGDLFLVLEYVEGLNLEQEINDLAARGDLPGVDQIVRWARGVSAILARLHALGLVHGDVKPQNAIVPAEGDIRMVDFETVRPPDGAGDPVTSGTHGYLSPQRRAGAPATVADDVYALGAVISFLATSANPSDAPDADHLLERPLAVLNPALPPSLVDVIARCLDHDRAARPGSVDEVDRALAAVAGGTAAPARPPAARPEGAGEWAAAAGEWAAAAGALAAELVRTAAAPGSGLPGVCWPDAADAPGPPKRDLASGASGIVLTLVEAAQHLAVPGIEATMAEGARWLAAAPPFPGGPHPGLYVGESGVGAALLRTGLALGDHELIEAATRTAALVAGLPHVLPDLYGGSAGRARFHLAMWEATGDRRQLTAAVDAAEHLLAQARPADGLALAWTVPPGHGSESGRPMLGYAHGIAGIGDALLDVYEVTGDDRFAAAGRRVADGLRAQAEACLDDGSGLDWRTAVSGERVGGFWCHGAGGVGRFLLHAGTVGVMPDGVDLARRAGHTVARGARWSGPSQCHGLAGNIEFLLDLHAATGDGAFQEAAVDFGRLMVPFARAALRGPREEVGVRDHHLPSLALGYAGMATALIRLSVPERAPHLLGYRALARPTPPRARLAGAGRAG
jgi:hypothetical protein